MGNASRSSVSGMVVLRRPHSMRWNKDDRFAHMKASANGRYLRRPRAQGTEKPKPTHKFYVRLFGESNRGNAALYAQRGFKVDFSQTVDAYGEMVLAWAVFKPVGR